jgi:Glycosyl hydrolases family 6
MLDWLLQAYVWVKPPGESDGSSQATTPGNVPDAEGKRFDPSCDPNDPSKVRTTETQFRRQKGVQNTQEAHFTQSTRCAE